MSGPLHWKRARFDGGDGGLESQASQAATREKLHLHDETGMGGFLDMIRCF